MTQAQVKARQRALNRFTKKYLKYVTPLRVDGEYGHSTKKRVRVVKYYLGYPKDERTAKFGRQLFWRMKHPKRRHPEWATLRRIAVGSKRRIEQRRKAIKDHKATQALAGRRGFGTFDGKTVAAWMVPILQESRRNGWHGTVASGVRTPSYSRYLCIRMCGAPSCPGRCAGLASNHNMTENQGKPYGALDVTDYYNFGRIQKKIGSPLVNHLGARDPVHFSVSGR